MAIPGTAFPGTALIGQAVPGFVGPPAGTPGQGIIVGTTPVLLASSAVAADPYPSGECYITNGDTTIYLGGSAHLTVGNGFPVDATANAPVVHLFSGDAIWARTASGTSTVYVTQTGS
jgi:hypothetical protein